MKFVIVNVIEGKNRFCTFNTVPSSVVILLHLICTQSLQLSHSTALWFFCNR